ncbi:geranylgeranyl reductase family protein [Actinoplanes sp. NPDC051861]|uniref:geranylgeranyl reductase family protein n=1 Tax=Actinoplanes sp. NPDC051861 TaxID=3155170 RepID=UPI003431F124
MGIDVYDVAVIGAGPAGSAAALAARRAGARVLLLDRADFPRDKTCGDGIAAQAVDVLSGLGVADTTAGYPQVETLRLVSPGGTAAARRLPHPAYVIPRRVFDFRITRAAVAAGAVLHKHQVREVREEHTVVIDGEFRARVVIGADGASSVVRRALGSGVNPPGHLAIAIRGYRPATTREQLIVTTRQRWPAYAWEFPIGDGTANVGYGELLRGTALSRPYLLKQLNDLLPGAEPTGLRGHHLPLSTRRPAPGRGRVLLAGDALSLINPCTGEGIFYAVLSGALAGACAAGGPIGVARRYRDALHRRLGRHLRHSATAARLTSWPRVADAAIGAAANDPAVFARMVELGLADGLLDARTIGRIALRMVQRPTVGA